MRTQQLWKNLGYKLSMRKTLCAKTFQKNTTLFWRSWQCHVIILGAEIEHASFVCQLQAKLIFSDVHRPWVCLRPTFWNPGLAPTTRPHTDPILTAKPNGPQHWVNLMPPETSPTQYYPTWQKCSWNSEKWWPRNYKKYGWMGTFLLHAKKTFRNHHTLLLKTLHHSWCPAGGVSPAKNRVETYRELSRTIPPQQCCPLPGGSRVGPRNCCQRAVNDRFLFWPVSIRHALYNKSKVSNPWAPFPARTWSGDIGSGGRAGDNLLRRVNPFAIDGAALLGKIWSTRVMWQQFLQ